LNEIFEEIVFPDFLIPCLLRSLLFHPILVEGIIAMVRIKACARYKFVERAREHTATTNEHESGEERDGLGSAFQGTSGNNVQWEYLPKGTKCTSTYCATTLPINRYLPWPVQHFSV
jgi:hypothetical protein